MLAITAKLFPADEENPRGWNLINLDGRGYSDVLELARLAGIDYSYSPLAKRYRTKREAMAAAQAVADRASCYTVYRL